MINEMFIQLFLFQFQADEFHLRAGGELIQHSTAGHFRQRVLGHLPSAQQIFKRTPDPGSAPDLPQADQVSGHMPLEQHRPPAQTGKTKALKP